MTDNLLKVERRKFPRFNCNYPLLFLRYNDLKERTNDFFGEAINISLGGIKIKTNEIFPVDEPIEFAVKMERTQIRAKGRVIYKYIDYEGYSNIGVLFEEISPGDLDILGRFLNDMLGR
jgi:hypothetical protein